MDVPHRTNPKQEDA